MTATRPSARSGQDYICNCTGARVSTISVDVLDGERFHRFSLDWVVGDVFPLNASVLFMAPSVPFVIKTSGTDENGLPFQRISRTIVPGRAGPPVYIGVGDTTIWGVEGKPLLLSCPYRSVVSVTVSWRKDGSLAPGGSGYLTNADGRLLIERASLSDAGRYQCRVSSSEGDTTGQVLNVKIASKKRVVLLTVQLEMVDYLPRHIFLDCSDSCHSGWPSRHQRGSRG